MKIILSKHKNILVGLGLLIVGIAIGVGSMTYQTSIFRLIKSKSIRSAQPTKIVDETEAKKQALSKFYNQILTAQDTHDWVSMYTLIPQSARENISQEQFATAAGQWQSVAFEKTVSQKTIINNVTINGNKGTVDRTIITCLTKECTGDNRKEDNGQKQFEYVDGKWQMPDPQPSERALKAVNYVYEDMSKNNQNDILNRFSYGSDNLSYAIRNWAVYLDTNLEKLVRLETFIDKNKAEQSRPVVNYQPPDINIQQPQQQAPAQQNNSLNCTSQTVGSSTYTNCY